MIYKVFNVVGHNALKSVTKHVQNEYEMRSISRKQNCIILESKTESSIDFSLNLGGYLRSLIITTS